MVRADVKVEIEKQQRQIEHQGRLAAGERSYLARNAALYGRRRRLPPSRTLAARLTKPGRPRPKSTVETVELGKAPEGFGKRVLWAPDDSALALLIYLNATDSLGVAISGVKATDTIEFISDTGVASFAEETENEGVASFIGIVAAGASAVASAYGAPEAVPVIEKADQFAESLFKEKEVKTKRRDPFGEDPGTGHKARQEGGVIVSLPEARQLFYSGGSDHEERWIKEPGTRDDAHRPDHVKDAFFLQGGTKNQRIAGEDGSFLIAPWDYKFSDNFGFYRLEAIVRRGSGKPEKVE
jgi:hypothetical protein